MKYMVRKSVIDLVGLIWLPSMMCAQRKELSPHDVENCRDKNGKITRESVERWLLSHSGDFQSVHDFSASIEDGEETVEILWYTDDGKAVHADCTAIDI